ncbi:MAG TPA: MFS transporter [Actinoplanes sp.]|nr:MFS transporter [Actinoplanes sp.]
MTATMAMTATATTEPGILRRPYALTTAGSWSLVFLAAFESLAVTTIMPIVTADLDGRSLYSLAFSATLAAGVVGMVVTGGWADRRGPAAPLFTAIALFAVGLIVAGTAPSMVVFVAGRFLQGLGAGGITVALYVLIAKVYPPELHVRIFGAYASAWVLPSMVGPFAAGVVADVLGWRWVFLGVVLLVVVALAMIAPALRPARSPCCSPPHGRCRRRWLRSAGSWPGPAWARCIRGSVRWCWPDPCPVRRASTRRPRASPTRWPAVCRWR